jgi:hypothetical protein
VEREKRFREEREIGEWKQAIATSDADNADETRMNANT